MQYYGGIDEICVRFLAEGLMSIGGREHVEPQGGESLHLLLYFRVLSCKRSEELNPSVQESTDCIVDSMIGAPENVPNLSGDVV